MDNAHEMPIPTHQEITPFHPHTQVFRKLRSHRQDVNQKGAETVSFCFNLFTVDDSTLFRDRNRCHGVVREWGQRNSTINREEEVLN